MTTQERMKEFDRLENEMRELFSGFEPEPPSHVWDTVERSISPVRRNAFMPVFSRVAAAVVFLTIAGFSYWFLSNDSRVQQQFAGVEEPTAPISETLQAVDVYSAIENDVNQVLAAALTVDPTPAYIDLTGRKETAPVPSADKPIPGLLKPLMPQGLAVSSSRLLAYDATSFSLSGQALAEQNSATRHSSGTAAVSFGLTAYAAPQYSYRQFSSTSQAGLPLESLEDRLFNLDYGFSAFVSIGKRWIVESGLGIVKTGQMIKDVNAWSYFDNRPFYNPEFAKDEAGHPQRIATSMGMILMQHNPSLYFSDESAARVQVSNTKLPFDYPVEPKLLDMQGNSLRQSFGYIEVPVTVRYMIADRLPGVQLKMGVAANFLYENNVYLVSQQSESPVGQTLGVRDLGFSGIGGLALTLPVSHRMRVFVEPTFRYFFTPVMGSGADGIAGFTARPYTFSVNSGLSYRF